MFAKSHATAKEALKGFIANCEAAVTSLIMEKNPLFS